VRIVLTEPSLVTVDHFSRKEFSERRLRLRRILVCMTGKSPQVVTETLYALARRPDPYIPDEIHLITTIDGEILARKTLLDRETGELWRLVRDLSLPLTPGQVCLSGLLSRDGEKLPDIRTVEENEDAADGILGKIRELTSDPDTTVHVSMAGGRKTMGFYAGYALSLFGRPQDRLSHVLISPTFEFVPDFFYPSLRPNEKIIRTANGDLLDAYDATVTLAEIPLVYIRHGLPSDLLQGEVGFSESVRTVQKAFRSPELLIDIKERRIRVGGKIISLSPTQLSFLAWFALRRINGEPPVHYPKWGTRNQEYARAYLSVYRQVVGEFGGAERTIKNLSEGMEQEFFAQTASKLNQHLKKILGPEGSRPYRIEGSGTRFKTYSLSIAPEYVRFCPIDGESSSG